VINRLWYGWTTTENADRFETLLRNNIIPEVEQRGLQGYKGAQLMRRDESHEVEFVTVLKFDTLADVEAFAGKKYQQAMVTDKVRELLLRYSTVSYHYEVKAEFSTQP
jgi:antibiotic biosynthesis monooxygenase (ABM) superfamily enzyme